MERYVIIGNGTAAVGCIEGIRETDKSSPITVISAENHPVYGRPLISYYLEGKTTLENMAYRPADFYERNGVEVLYGREAKALDVKAHVVKLDNGETVQYTKLCVAAGSSPFVPPMKGLESVPQKYSFMTLDDALALEKVLTPESRVLIVGAGLIGLKCAEGIRERVGAVAVCDLAPRVLSSILDEQCAAPVQKCLEENGIQLLLGDTVAEFSGRMAKMKSGKTVKFDVLVLAVGVRANTALVKEAGGEVNRGIIVDTACKTNIQDIYAAGDCTEGYDLSIGANRVLALLPNAKLQGLCAGRNMAGNKAEFTQGIPMNSIGFFGLHIMTAGSYPTPEEGGQCYEESDDKHLKRMYTKDDRLAGYIMVGEVEKAGIYTALIRNQTPLSETAFEELRQNPSFAAFQPAYRKTKLGGVV